MDDLNDLPKRDRNHAIESRAASAFENCLSVSNVFLLQRADRNDYGTDYQIEVIDGESVSNVRVHVQLKGTERALNANGSVSVQVSRSNLNYLMMNPYSFYVCYHSPTDVLFICSADSVRREYEHNKENWSEQETLTVRFSDLLTERRLKSLAALAKSSAVLSRDSRVRQSTARSEDVPSIVQKALPDLYVPQDEKSASEMLAGLYDTGADVIISAAFDKFLSVLGRDHDAMGFCYMSEINLGMGGKSRNTKRIEDGISHLTRKLEGGRYQIGSLHYSIGNGFSALGREKDAIARYENALLHLSAEDRHLLAQCYKNLGSSFEKLGQEDKAVGYYHDALRLSPHLGEAHYALGSHYHRKGEYEAALSHFDNVVLPERALGKISSVAGWRINVLFNLGDGKGAFREINGLLGDAGSEGWVWPWCARQVASFGRAAVENARPAIAFWNRYLKAHPKDARGMRELLLAKFYLRSKGQDLSETYAEFKTGFDAVIAYVAADDVAFLWDRLGHWAQDDENWIEAERCFRKAYDLDGGHYGYCLGTALNFLDRFEESLPILIAQAESIQPDDLSWFQVAVAYGHLGRVSDSSDAYKKSIALNPNYDLAWFSLGGLHWNSGDQEEASRVWKKAAELFPNHELTSKLRRELPSVLR